MLRRYEAMFIVDADLDADQAEKILDRYTKIITDGGGTISYAGRWEQGRRKLAYDIDRRREGFYQIIQFESEAAVTNEMDRIFRISDDVFRHMIVQRDDKVPILTPPSAEPAPEPVAAVAEEAEAVEPEAIAETEEPELLEAEEPIEAEAAEVPAAEPEAAEETEAEPAAV